MGKKKSHLDARAERSRRAANRAALKMKMQRLTRKAFKEDETLEILSDEDEAVPIIPPKKKYCLTHRKSSNDRDVIVLKTVKNEEDALSLECWADDLSPAQIRKQNKAQKEWDTLNKNLDSFLKDHSNQLVYEGDSYVVYDVPNNQVAPTQQENVTALPQATPRLQSMKNNGSASALKLVMDPKSGVVLGTMTPTTLSTVQTPVQAARSGSPIILNKRHTRGSSSLGPPAKIMKLSLDVGKSVDQPTVSGNSSTSKGIKVVDLTADDSVRPVADSREVTFNKMNGKTFPSLVVVARPLLHVIDFNSNRNILDGKVKTVLMHPPTKFTEWLIQQGLLRSEQVCANHPNFKLKLGIYNDASKFTISGGYVWVSDCCPSRFVTVFKGSIFEGSPHSSVVILKLIYHWACQTPVQNVIGWVKVDNLYIKSMYTLLRSVCTVAIQNHLPKLGGPGVKVEIGVISLGTTSHDGNQRQVKVEVLGVLESATKKIRLRAVEPLEDGDRNYKKRFLKILEPLTQWVHTDTFIVTDLTVDKSTLISMGFTFVHQTTSVDPTYSNNTVMEYLRRVVPRMFQNTLSLLSRQIIQQFLDELVWREWYGTTANYAFDNIIAHIAEQTKMDFGMSLTLCLNKVAQNPFNNWNYNTFKTPLKQVASSSAPISISANKRPTFKRVKIPVNPGATSVDAKSKKMPTADDSKQLIPLENYYYGTLPGGSVANEDCHFEIVCSLCKRSCKSNVDLMDHLYAHATNTTTLSRKTQCRYCLLGLKQSDALNTHISYSHPMKTKCGVLYACLICGYKSKTILALGKHMSLNHVPSELPYKCQMCGFRTSYHADAINHFYNTHAGGNALQCPFCLKIEMIAKKKRTPYVSAYVQHLMKHLKKGLYKKCTRCTLTFITKDEYKEHSTKMHRSLRSKPGLIKSVPKNGYMVPLSQIHFEYNEDTVNLKQLYFDADAHLKCVECSETLIKTNHFPSVQCCSNDNCLFTTCCKKAMQKHKCRVQNTQLPSIQLPFDLYCVCGYTNKDGNKMANHLAVCERKSAYPSMESATAAIVTHSMLDVLGLVRKPEEPSSSSEIKTTTFNQEVTIIDKPEVPNNEDDDKVIEIQDNDVEMTTKNDESNVGDKEIFADEVTLIDDNDTIESLETEKAETEKAEPDSNKDNEILNIDKENEDEPLKDTNIEELKSTENKAVDDDSIINNETKKEDEEVSKTEDNESVQSINDSKDDDDDDVNMESNATVADEQISENKPESENISDDEEVPEETNDHLSETEQDLETEMMDVDHNNEIESEEKTEIETEEKTKEIASEEDKVELVIDKNADDIPIENDKISEAEKLNDERDAVITDLEFGNKEDESISLNIEEHKNY